MDKNKMDKNGVTPFLSAEDKLDNKNETFMERLANQSATSHDITSFKTYRKSNSLINAKGRGTLMAQKLFAIGMQRVTVDKTNNVVATILTSDLKKIFNTNSGSLYTSIEAACDHSKSDGTLFDWTIMQKDDEKQEITARAVITDAIFKNGKLTIRFNNSLTNDIVNIKNNYTILSLKETMDMKSVYSLRLLEILKSAYSLSCYHNPGPGERVFDYHIVELKFDLGIITPEGDSKIKNELNNDNPDYDKIQKWITKNKIDKYCLVGDFQKRVIKPSVAEINKKTDIHLEYETIRSGRKVTGIRFFVSKPDVITQNNELAANNNISISEDDMLDELVDLMHNDFKTSEIRIFLQLAGNMDKVKNAYEYFKTYPKDIENTVGFMREAILKGYSETKPRRKKAAVNEQANFFDFEQRDYSDEEYRQIEEHMRNRNS